jgi:hypothetical protein
MKPVTERVENNPTAVPLRIAKRPDPSQWSDIELMSLYEAAALFWPDGPLTVTSLRTAVRDGKLAVAEIAGKLLTTKTAIAEMSTRSLRGCGSRPAEVDDGMPAPKTGGPIDGIRARRRGRKLAC